MCPFNEANVLALNAFYFSFFYFLQCIIQYAHLTPCKAPLAAPPRAREVNLRLYSDASRGVFLYLVRNADGAFNSHVHHVSLSTFLAQVLARLKLRCDRKARVLVVRDWCGV